MNMFANKDDFSFLSPDTPFSDHFHNDHHADCIKDAFSYWSALQLVGQTPFVSFSDLTPDGLAPFKGDCFMLSLGDWENPMVRFAGDQAQSLLKTDMTSGSAALGMGKNSFDTNLEQALSVLFENQQPFIVPWQDLDALFLPLSRGDDILDLVLIVVAPSTNQAEDGQGEATAQSIDTSPLQEILNGCRAVADKVVHVDSRTRETLYDALASAMDFYEESIEKSTLYSALLKEEGLKTQDRAPFTPILKLVFGKEYDKTRLTEYAAALSYARRNGKDKSTLSAFLSEHPGGIKGCVKAERKERRSARGNFTADQLEDARSHLRGASSIKISDLSIKDEFSLVLVRKNADDTLETIAMYEATQAATETALKQIARQQDTATNQKKVVGG